MDLCLPEASWASGLWDIALSYFITVPHCIVYTVPTLRIPKDDHTSFFQASKPQMDESPPPSPSPELEIPTPIHVSSILTPTKYVALIAKDLKPHIKLHNAAQGLFNASFRVNDGNVQEELFSVADGYKLRYSIYETREKIAYVFPSEDEESSGEEDEVVVDESKARMDKLGPDHSGLIFIREDSQSPPRDTPYSPPQQSHRPRLAELPDMRQSPYARIARPLIIQPPTHTNPSAYKDKENTLSTSMLGVPTITTYSTSEHIMIYTHEKRKPRIEFDVRDDRWACVYYEDGASREMLVFALMDVEDGYWIETEYNRLIFKWKWRQSGNNTEDGEAEEEEGDEENGGEEEEGVGEVYESSVDDEYEPEDDDFEEEWDEGEQEQWRMLN